MVKRLAPTVSIEKAGSIPIYMQLAAAIEAQIHSGALEAGVRIESEAALCARFEISRVTARLAMDELVKKGLVERKQGKGTFVFKRLMRHEPSELNFFFDSFYNRGLVPTSRLLDFSTRIPPADIAALFGTAAGQTLVRLDRLWICDNQKLGFSEGWLPAEMQRFSKELAESTSTARLFPQIGLSASDTWISMTAGLAGIKAARLLDVPQRSPVLLINRTRSLYDGRLIESVRFTLNPKLYEFSFKPGNIPES